MHVCVCVRARFQWNIKNNNHISSFIAELWQRFCSKELIDLIVCGGNERRRSRAYNNS
jgi:hypothetical protein